MADEVQQQPPLIDPGNITETICDGPVNISVRGPLATLTFTHAFYRAAWVNWVATSFFGPNQQVTTRSRRQSRRG